MGDYPVNSWPLCKSGCRVSDGPRNLLKPSFILFSMFTAVNESVCIVNLSQVSLAFSCATRMAVISESSTDAESLSLMVISCSMCTTADTTRVPSPEPVV